MEKNNAIEKIYDLIEKYNFDELSPEERDFVLTLLTETEYRDMRITVGDTIRYFSSRPKENSLPLRKPFTRFLNYRLELYKVAAIFIIMLGLGVGLTLRLEKSPDSLLARADTVFVHKTDTFLVEHRDTLEIIREKVVYRDKVSGNEEALPPAIRQPDIPGTELCKADICPGDLEIIDRFNSKNDCSRDNNLKEFMVSLN